MLEFIRHQEDELRSRQPRGQGDQHTDNCYRVVQRSNDAGAFARTRLLRGFCSRAAAMRKEHPRAGIGATQVGVRGPVFLFCGPFPRYED